MSSETYDAVGRLCKVKFEHGMSSLGRMSAIGRAILPGEEGHMWTTDSCEKLRDKLIDLLQSSWNDGFDDGYASADDWLADHEDAMREHGWVRKEEIDAVRHECERRIERVVDGVVPLPLDVDGNAIHVGDWVAGRNNTGHWKWLASFRVGCLVYRSTGWEVAVVSPDTCNVYTYPCDMLRVTRKNGEE